jgi:hypothetical protein
MTRWTRIRGLQTRVVASVMMAGAMVAVPRGRARGASDRRDDPI